jgi:hypothetical protein
VSTSSCLPSLHPPKKWSLRQTRGDSSWQAIAREVGISASGLKRWSEGVVSTPARLRRVRVRGDGGLGGGIAAVPPRALTLVTPSGFRVEGLSREDVAALVREFGA